MQMKATSGTPILQPRSGSVATDGCRWGLCDLFTRFCSDVLALREAKRGSPWSHNTILHSPTGNRGSARAVGVKRAEAQPSLCLCCVSNILLTQWSPEHVRACHPSDLRGFFLFCVAPGPHSVNPFTHCLLDNSAWSTLLGAAKQNCHKLKKNKTKHESVMQRLKSLGTFRRPNKTCTLFKDYPQHRTLVAHHYLFYIHFFSSVGITCSLCRKS